MYMLASAAGRVHCFVEPRDSVVITDLMGKTIAGPAIAPLDGSVVTFDYDGPSLDNCCWGVLNSDGTLAFQSESIGSLFGGSRVRIEIESPPTYLTPEDRQWLQRVSRIQ
jgi:hypothetical protein